MSIRTITRRLAIPVWALCLVVCASSLNATLMTSVSGNTPGGGCLSAGTTTASCQVSGIDVHPYWGPMPYLADGSAKASYGSLFASVAVRVGLGYSDAIATAGFIDKLTILGGSGAGFIQYMFIDTVSSCNTCARSTASFQQGSAVAEDFDPASASYLSQLYSFTFGIPFQVSATLSTDIHALDWEYGDNTVSVDLSQLKIYDSNMNPIAASVLAESGTLYPTPEASSIVLFSFALIAVAGIVRFKRSRRSSRET